MDYKVSPGLYAIGDPDETSPVLVSANYKLTFDTLRKELTDLKCYLLILDTKGINVWCAAGKGTFGTEELIARTERTGLKNVVTHRKLILPQLGAPGICAHEVTKRTGFDVVYGPVRASDLKEFIANGMKATDEMRKVSFTIRDRTVLVPMEFIPAMKISVMIFGLLFLLNFVLKEPFGICDLMMYMGAVAAGTIITPMLLPFIPGRAFSLKGWISGMCWTLLFVYAAGWFSDDLVTAIGYIFLAPAISAYFAFKFTGSSTYTSLSGVTKEMKAAVPLIVMAVAIGSILLLIGKVI